jgi:hypothetical protein
MEALRAIVPRATMATLTSPMDAKVTTDFTRVDILPPHENQYSLVYSSLERLPLFIIVHPHWLQILMSVRTQRYINHA